MPFTMKTFSSTPDQKARRNSTKMSSQPAMLPYRDENNITIKYSPATTTTEPQNAEDSEAEALIRPNLPSELSDYDRQHFTATGRPQPTFKASALANLSGDVYSVPQLLPKRYTDDSIIPAIITDVIPAQKVNPEMNGKEKKGGLLSKLKGGSKKDEPKDKIMKVVYMPRWAYQKWFARDQKANYIGSEEHRRWTEEELESEFARYKPEPTQERMTGVFSGTGGLFKGSGGEFYSLLES